MEKSNGWHILIWKLFRSWYLTMFYISTHISQAIFMRKLIWLCCKCVQWTRCLLCCIGQWHNCLKICSSWIAHNLTTVMKFPVSVCLHLWYRKIYWTETSVKKYNKNNPIIPSVLWNILKHTNSKIILTAARSWLNH